jgi:hypothetical protein
MVTSDWENCRPSLFVIPVRARGLYHAHSALYVRWQPYQARPVYSANVQYVQVRTCLRPEPGTLLAEGPKSVIGCGFKGIIFEQVRPGLRPGTRSTACCNTAVCPKTGLKRTNFAHVWSSPAYGLEPGALLAEELHGLDPRLKWTIFAHVRPSLRPVTRSFAF